MVHHHKPNALLQPQNSFKLWCAILGMTWRSFQGNPHFQNLLETVWTQVQCIQVRQQVQQKFLCPSGRITLALPGQHFWTKGPLLIFHWSLAKTVNYAPEIHVSSIQPLLLCGGPDTMPRIVPRHPYQSPCSQSQQDSPCWLLAQNPRRINLPSYTWPKYCVDLPHVKNNFLHASTPLIYNSWKLVSKFWHHAPLPCQFPCNSRHPPSQPKHLTSFNSASKFHPNFCQSDLHHLQIHACSCQTHKIWTPTRESLTFVVTPLAKLHGLYSGYCYSSPAMISIITGYWAAFFWKSSLQMFKDIIPPSRHAVIDTIFMHLLDHVPELLKSHSTGINPWKSENHPHNKSVQFMHASLRSQPISNSGSPQDHLPMSIILTSNIRLHPVHSKHFHTMWDLPVKNWITTQFWTLCLLLWMLGHPPFRGK